MPDELSELWVCSQDKSKNNPEFSTAKSSQILLVETSEDMQSVRKEVVLSLVVTISQVFILRQICLPKPYNRI